MVTNINGGMKSAALQQQNKVQQKSEEKNIKTEAISKAEDIKRQIEAGTYKIDIAKSAEALADTLL